ncbi:MAG: DUF1587 domain-containing protein [Planctomycetota bacterium]|nr:MAG: DUF1587 domain-containing protein [Planctomycetota bacterium]
MKPTCADDPAAAAAAARPSYPDNTMNHFTRSARKHVSLCLLAIAAWTSIALSAAAEDDPFEQLRTEYAGPIHAMLETYCLDCHAADVREGELDLERFAALEDVRRDATTWLKVAEMLAGGEMPPEESAQPSDAQRQQLQQWIDRYVKAEAAASAGDPGPVVLRRLNNAQYTYTIRDLTGIELSPTREFPADNAAGEGFTNAGGALVMSPSLLTKYLDAGKDIARHAVLLPDGFRFSPGTTRRDWTDEVLAEIRQMYVEHAGAGSAADVNLHGLHWKTRGGGNLQVEAYLAATLAAREALTSGERSVEEVAQERGLNAKYLGSLWKLLNEQDDSPVLEVVRARWRDAQPDGAAALAAEIARWQEALQAFQAVGHMKPWMVPVTPLTARQEFRVDLGQLAGDAVTLYLAAGTAGDGGEHDQVFWQRPRLVVPGRPDLPLRDVRAAVDRLVDHRKRVLSATEKSLLAADEASRSSEASDTKALSAKYNVAPEVLSSWFTFLGIEASDNVQLDRFENRLRTTGGYDFVQGWGSPQTPSLVANASDQEVRIPGRLKPHGVAVHPSPTLYAAVGWKSPLAGAVRIEGKVADAHAECGNGVTWALELRRGYTRQTLASGTAGSTAIGPLEAVAVRPGDRCRWPSVPRTATTAAT